MYCVHIPLDGDKFKAGTTFGSRTESFEMVAADEAVVELVELEFEDVSSAGSKANDLFHWSSSMNF